LTLQTKKKKRRKQRIIGKTMEKSYIICLIAFAFLYFYGIIIETIIFLWFFYSAIIQELKMQKDQAASTAHGGHTSDITTTIISSPLKSQLHPDGGGYTSLYSPIFPTKSSLSVSSFSDLGFSDSSSTVVSNHLYHSRSVQEHQEIVNRHSLCLTHLHEATIEAEALRRENTHLRAVNCELNKYLGLFIQLGSPSADYTAPFGLLDAFRGLSIGGKGSAAWDDVADASPTSVIESGRVQNVDVERGRFSLPKSISVRSSGYMKTATHQASARGGGGTRSATRFPSTSPLNVTVILSNILSPACIILFTNRRFSFFFTFY
jgi:hypothetical protein